MFKYDDFSVWADSVFENEFPDDTVAVCFNLYEESDKDTYSVQIVGARVFDEEDWSCDETFSSENNLYIWKEKGGMKKAFETAKKNVVKYINEGKSSKIIKAYDGVGIGFVDGDIEII